MSNIVELVHRTDRLRDQVEFLRQELDELRQNLLQLESEGNGLQTEPPAAHVDCLSVAIALAQDLGPGFSSEQPHDLAERGHGWFTEP